MPVWMYWLNSGDSDVPVTIISVALMLAAGFLMTRITKKLRLPNVTAYIVGGILAGPFVLNLVPETVVEGTSFLQDFVTVFRRLVLTIDEIEQNPAYVGSGLSVYSISISVSNEMLKKYKTHAEIIEALKSLDYVYHIEEMRA